MKATDGFFEYLYWDWNNLLELIVYYLIGI